MANRELELNSGMRCAKYMLVIVSFMFAVSFSEYDSLISKNLSEIK